MDDPGYLTMSAKELNRLEVLNRVLDRRLTQAQAAEQLGLGIRQVQRLCSRLRIEGPRGLVSRKRGRVSNRKLPDDLRRRALELIVSRYSDFGPTLAGEKLRAIHGVAVSVETLRRWMIAAELWVPRSQRQRVHQPRRLQALGGNDDEAAPAGCLCAYPCDAPHPGECHRAGDRLRNPARWLGSNGQPCPESNHAVRFSRRALANMGVQRTSRTRIAARKRWPEGVPYEGIEGLPPETIALREQFFFAQKLAK